MHIKNVYLYKYGFTLLISQIKRFIFISNKDHYNNLIVPTFIEINAVILFIQSVLNPTWKKQVSLVEREYKESLLWFD